jgi:biotin operon repressor
MIVQHRAAGTGAQLLQTDLVRKAYLGLGKQNAGPRRQGGVSPLQAVDRALRLLDLMANGSPHVGVSELARATGWSKAVVFRLLRTLEAHGYVARDDTRRYRRVAGVTLLRKISCSDRRRCGKPSKPMARAQRTTVGIATFPS